MWRSLLLADPEGRAWPKKDKLLYFLFCLYFLFLYLPGISDLYPATMWVIFLYSFFYSSLKERIRILALRREMIFVLLFFGWSLVSLAWTSDLKEGVSWAGIRISTVIFALTMGSFSLRKEFQERMMLAFVVVTSLAATGAFIRALNRAAIRHETSYLYNDSLSMVLNLQSIYFAMLITLAVYILVYLALYSRHNRWMALWWILPVLLLVHFLLASRLALISLYGMGLIFGVLVIVRRRKYLEGAVLLMGLMLGAFLLTKMFPKTVNRFRELAYTGFDFRNEGPESHYDMKVTADQWNGANIRLAVWNCGWSVIRQNIFWGVGLGDKMDALKEQYSKRGFEFGIRSNRNMHNTYLDVWMTLGLPGLLLFLMAFVVIPLRKCWRYGDGLAAFVIGTLVLAMFFETYLDRTVGNSILGLFSAWMASRRN